MTAQQSAAGHWVVPHGSIARPPIEDGDIARTALGVLALKNYGAPGRAADFNERIARAGAWLAKAILASQRSDGGWPQRLELQSDAYATGQTLYALSASDVLSPREPAYQKGVKYLLATQHADGSWYVRSRAPKFQPYFESGFPYGGDQWISQMATGWAAAALMLAIDEP